MMRHAAWPWLLCVLLLAAAAALRFDPGPVPAPRTAPAPAAAIAALPAMTLPALPPPLDRLTETMARPLFEASRRPPPTGPGLPAEAVHGVVVLARYLVTGVVLAGKSRVLLLRDLTAEKPLRLRQGEALDGWTLTALDATSLTLTRGDARQSIALQPAP